MRIEFVKMNGSGNDFLVFDSPPGAALSADKIRQLAHRQTGIGFDQALVLEPPRRTEAAIFYRIFNSDGLEVEQCGNGARCIASLLFRRGRTQADSVTLESPAGLVHAQFHGPNLISVDMGAPNFDPRSLPFDAPEEAESYGLDVNAQTIQIGAVSMGNPHAVVTVASAQHAPVATLGAAIEHHARFPNGVNAGFVEIVDRSHI